MSSTTVRLNPPTQHSPSESPLRLFSNPGNQSEPVLDEAPVHERDIATLSRHRILEKETLGKTPAQDTHAPVLTPFQFFVASPATPDTPTPVPQLGCGHSISSFTPSPLSGSASPDRSCSPFSAPSLSPPDSPYPYTPTLSPFDSDPGVAEGGGNDADPFDTSISVADKVEKAPAIVVPTVPLETDSRHDFREPLSLRSSIKEMVRPSQPGAHVPALGRTSNHLAEEPFKRGESLSFHRSPRRYTLDQKKASSKPNGDAPNLVFVSRSSPHIIEEDYSDEESGPEDQDDEKSVYSFSCEDSKINELVSMMASLSLGTAPTVARLAITPTRIRSRFFPFFPARTVVPSLVAAFHPSMNPPSDVQHATTMEVDKNILCLNLASTGAPHPQGTPEAVSMDGVVFHPEVKDVGMMDTFATNPGAALSTPPTCGPVNIMSAFARTQPAFGTTSPKYRPNQAQRSDLGAPSSPSQQSRVPQRTIFDFLCQPPKPAISSGSIVSTAGIATS